MAETLRFPTSPEVLEKMDVSGAPLTERDFAEVFGAIIKDLNVRGGTEKYELRVANALWGQKDYRFLSSFTDLVETEYGGTLQAVDFVKAAERARQTVNTWVEKQTNGKIKDLISRGVLDAMTRLVLTNAIYFKGNWARQFDEERTREAPFMLRDGEKVQAPMMNQRAEFGYAETEQLQVLELPYVGQELSMVILLPKDVNGIESLEEQLDADNLTLWVKKVRQREVIVSVPKFEMTSKFNLERVLAALGMPLAFSRGADFSGMTGKRDLFISAVIHQAYVDVNEEGTEAAAATAVTMKLTSIGPDRTPVFRADHPFVFMIRDVKSGSILFLGRVENPTLRK
jgi:serpin B